MIYTEDIIRQWFPSKETLLNSIIPPYCFVARFSEDELWLYNAQQ
jgi:hypothetical protein